MTDGGRRSRVRWVVAHPHRPAVLMAERAGRLALPETELGGQVWTADATATLPALRELVGLDAVLLRCEWTAFEPPERLPRAGRLAEPLSALHQAIGYRSVVADLRPVERHTAQSAAHWLRASSV
jgi:hypothetical protein